MNLLIDGSSLLWRVHHANKSQKREGVTNTIYSFIKSINAFANTYNSRDIYIAWDKKLKKKNSNFRETNTEGSYKGQRDKTEAQKVYASQEDIHKVTEMLGCKNLYPWTMEADDIIAWLSTTLEGSNTIITTDKDMLQLIDSKTCVYNPQKKSTIDKANFETSLGMPIEHFLAYKAILGDYSDNIRGINGCGPVNSKRMAKLWIETPDEVNEENTKIIEDNIKLMDLSIGYTLAGPSEVECYKRQIDYYKDLDTDMEAFTVVCKEKEFNSILKSIDNWKRTFEKPHLLKILGDLAF